MSPLVRKEMRLLLPYWGLAMLLAIIPPLALARDPHDPLNASLFWAFGFGMVLLGLAPFGYEFSGGTFSSLLVQPMDRRRIWRLKILLTGLAALLVLVSFESLLYWRTSLHLQDVTQELATRFSPSDARFSALQTNERNMTWASFWHTGSSIILVLLVAISGGFWATLLFRQTGAALWFVILVPGALAVALEASLHLLSAETQRLIITGAFTLYSLAGFIWARRMFATAQDSQWLGETIAVLELKSTKAQDVSFAPRRKAAIRALVRKEIQSHQISLLIAFGLLVLHICSLIFRGVYVLPRNSEFRFVVESVPFLWLLVPWLVGCVAIAEERKLGTMESQLCMPLSRRVQFIIKLIIALVLGVILGGIVPSIIEWIGLQFHISSGILGFASVTHSHLVARQPGSLVGMGAFIAICAAAFFISLVSVFASSLTRNTLHALGAAVVFGIAWLILSQVVAAQTTEFDYSLWKGPLIFIVGVPVAIIATIALSFSNYKTLHAGRNVWLRNLAVLFITLVSAGIATAVIYQRPWELAMSIEPRRGAPLPSGPVQPVICMPDGKIFALLPDGRVWTATDYRRKELDAYTESWDPVREEYQKQRAAVEIPTSGTFVAGSNWTALAANNFTPHIAGLQSDGTLWDLSPTNWQMSLRVRYDWISQVPEPRRVGSDNDWKAIAAGSDSFYGIKSNGTLWGWGENIMGHLVPGPHPYFEEPVQIGTNSDWSKFFPLEQGVLVMKTNGDLWPSIENQYPSKIHFERARHNGADWLNVSGSSYPELIIQRDGTLWANLRYPGTQHYFGARIPKGTIPRLARVGNESDWLQIIGSKQNLYAIKKDGRLVKDGTELFSSFLNRPSRYSDWLAGDARWGQMIALASDGTVCEWVDLRARGANGVFLSSTRRPLWSMNILKDSKN